MPFFRVTGYTKAEGELKDFVLRARDYEETVKKTADRVKRGMRVPNTWIKKLNGPAQTMLTVLDGHRLSVTEWTENYYRMLRFLDVYVKAQN